MSSRLRGPNNVNVYPEVALPATRKGIDLQFEGTGITKGQKEQKRLIQERINNLSSSLVELQNYIVDTMQKEFEDAGKRWSVVREGTEKSVQDFFSLVKGSNVKTAGKQFAFSIANVQAIKRELHLRGRGAAGQGSTASMVRELTDAIASEITGQQTGTGAMINRIADWLKNTTEEQIRAVKELESVQSKLIDIKRGDLSTGVAPTEDIKKQIKAVLARDRQSLNIAFKSTVGKEEAGKTGTGGSR